MDSAKGGLRGDPGVGDGQDAGTRDKVSSPSSLQTLSAEMRKVYALALRDGYGGVGAGWIEGWADRLDASAARQEERVQALGAAIDGFWQFVEHGYDIEPRAFFEKEAPINGFGSPLAQAAHHMWKRNPKVQELEAENDALRAHHRLCDCLKQPGLEDCTFRATATEQRQRVQKLEREAGRLERVVKIVAEAAYRADAKSLQLTAEIRSLRETRQEKKGADHARR